MINKYIYKNILEKYKKINKVLYNFKVIYQLHIKPSICFKQKYKKLMNNKENCQNKCRNIKK